MDYWNVVIDRAVGTQITIDLTDIYLQSITGADGVITHSVHNKHTDQPWIVSNEAFEQLQANLNARNLGERKGHAAKES